MAKSALKSKTVLVNLAIVGLARLWPGFTQLVSEYPEIYVMMHSILNIGLRFLTKQALRISGSIAAMIAIVALTACSSVPQKLEPGVFYKRDIGIEVNGREYSGVVVIPQAPRYEMVLKPKGKLDMVLIRSCHREYSGEKVSSGFLGIGKGQFKYTYVPQAGLEDVRVCPLRVEVYEAEKGRHSWAFLDFQHPAYSLPYTLTCNGSTSEPAGVGVCQAKAGLTQRIAFAEPVRFAPPMPVGCAMPMKRGAVYEFTASVGECLYHFDTQDGRLGRLTVIGFEGVLVRGE